MRKRWAVFAGLALTAPLSLVACVPYPSTEDQVNQDIVMTNYDSKANFGSFKTFAMPPDMTVLTEEANGGISVSQLPATDLIKAISDQMKAAGYTELQQGAQMPDLGVGLTGLVGSVEVYSSSYYCGYWYYWYYPYYTCYPTYPTTYEAYKTKTILIDLIDLKNTGGVPVNDAGRAQAGDIWTSALYGVLTSNNAYESARAVQGVNEAFAQSPYLKGGN